MTHVSSVCFLFGVCVLCAVGLRKAVSVGHLIPERVVGSSASTACGCHLLPASLLRIRAVLTGAISLTALVLIGVMYGKSLDQVPPHLAHDEVVIALNARSVARTGMDLNGSRFPVLFGDSAFGMRGGEPLTTYWTALVIKTFGDDEFAVRRASVIVGLLNVTLMFFVARRYFDSVGAGFSAALLLAGTPVHFFYSRVGVEVVYLLPFILGWLFLVINREAYLHHGSVGVISGGAMVLGLSVYAYKAALILAPAYLCLTVAIVTAQAVARGVPARRIWAMAAAAVGGFVLVAGPYAIDALRHTDRVAQVVHAYGVGDPTLTFLQNLHDFVRYQSVGTRLGIYFDSFNPTHLFFFGAGGWTDSTRQAGLFLIGAGVPIGVGLYASLGPMRSFSRSIVAAGFLLAPVSNFVLNEVTLRRMIPIAVFGVLLAIEGWRFIVRRWRFGRLIAVTLAFVTLAHFAWYYHDYVVDYPRNSYRAWELNIGEALRRLAERQQKRGGREHPLILVANRYLDDYARLYLGGSDLIEGAERRKPTQGSPKAVEGSRLVLRELLLDQHEQVSDACPAWRVSEIIREPHGDPSYVICEQ